jgi:phospholipase/lecithinase/hemolysin
MYRKPTDYFNGTEPANATGSVLTCGKETQCVTSPSPDSYLWFDELHPSEQASRLLAKEFVQVVSGKSRYANYLSL